MKEKDISTYFNFTPISNAFIDEHMLQANPIFVVIYIFLLKKFLSNQTILISEISNVLDILQSDIIKCMNYWKDKGLIEFEISQDTLNINFINKNNEKHNKIIIQKEMDYTEDEVTTYSEKEEIQQLFRIAENKFAKTLSYQDRKKIIQLFDGYGLSMEIFAILITYCKDKGKTNFNYIEKVAIDWLENGIDSIEKVESYIKLFDETYKKIMVAFGLRSQEPAPVQLEYMKKWVIELKIPINVIEEACKKTILQIGKPKFEYADKILINWKNQNIDTIEKIKEQDDKFKLEKQLKLDEFNKKMEKMNLDKVQQANIQRRNKFVNFEQPVVDFQKLRELELKALKGEI